MKKIIIAAVMCMICICGCSEKTSTAEISSQPASSIPETSEILGTLDETTVGDVGTKPQVIWENNQIEDEKITGFINDYITAVADEGYGLTNIITKYEYINAEILNSDEKDLITAKLNVKISYKPIDQKTSEHGEEVSTEFPCIIKMKSVNGEIDPSTVKGYADEENKSIYDVFPETDTYFGKLYPQEGKVVLKRMLFVNETGGYTDSGYFIADTDKEYTFDVNESTNISYFKTSDFVENMALEDFMKTDTEGKYYIVTYNGTTATDIIEVVLP